MRLVLSVVIILLVLSCGGSASAPTTVTVSDLANHPGQHHGFVVVRSGYCFVSGSGQNEQYFLYEDQDAAGDYVTLSDAVSMCGIAGTLGFHTAPPSNVRIEGKWDGHTLKVTKSSVLDTYPNGSQALRGSLQSFNQVKSSPVGYEALGI